MLHLPDNKGRFDLYLDTSKFTTGSALYQIHNGKPKLIAYTSKSLPEAARDYSITELGMCRLAINIAGFVHLLKRVDFDAVVDHFVAEPTTTRIKRLLEILSSYPFNLYYINGKDMILNGFLSEDIMIAIHMNMKSYQFCLTSKAYHHLGIIIYMKEI